ncbi:DNA primase [Acidocella sp.]|uniref:DNA primase n=1 Tax=Acidocella sp. TaxID=50710 RepID=UPI0026045934|nr:DNA primase [Acidocella sp.]
MALPAQFLDELRRRLPIATIIGRTVKLTRSGRERKGCCPFHGEKTPSFYVYDDHYHCFGCGEHGDAITFVMKTTGGSFMEAVEELAAQAGLEVPKPSPQAAEMERRRADLADVLAMAAGAYARWLYEPQGREALEYLRRRGLRDETIKRHGLGWSGEGRGQLAAALKGHDVKPAQLIEAGLMKRGDNGPVDMFFSRVMFPIRDRRGALISFGGRVLGDAQPKYVNGPETAVFAKRRALYGLDSAYEAVRRGRERLIVVEGYMDVISLAQAGFGGAVAPLGTALTEEHLDEIWRLTPEPVICFDGDKAGQRAALKTIEIALAKLDAGKGLRFLALPPKDDPDSLVKREGPQAFARALEAAKPLSDVMYDMVKSAMGAETPEARAGLRQHLVDLAGRIPDKGLGSEYRALLLERFFAERRARQTPIPPRAGGRKGGFAPPALVLPPHPSPDVAEADQKRARLMLATLLAFPVLFHDLEEAFAHVVLDDEGEALRGALHEFAAAQGALDSQNLLTHLKTRDLAGAAGRVQAAAAADFRFAPDASPSEAQDVWWSWFTMMTSSLDALRADRDSAETDWKSRMEDLGAWEKLKKYNELLSRALRGETGLPEG